MRNAKRLLELLHQAFPTSHQVRHNITLGQMYDEDQVLAERLGITVWFPRTVQGACFNQTFYLTDDEFDKTPEELVALIQKLVNEKNLDDPNS